MQQSCIFELNVCQSDASILLLSLDMPEMFINELYVCFLPTLFSEFVFCKAENKKDLINNTCN